MAKVWRCSYESVLLGTTFVNTFHVVARTPALTADAGADEVRDTLHAALTTKYRACLKTAYTLNSLTVREELAPGDTSIPAESVQTIGLAGTLGGGDTLLPLSMVQLVTFRTNAAVRSGHGRMFMPSSRASADLDANALWLATNPYWTNVTAFCNELKTHHDMGILGADGTLAQVVYSRTRRARGDADYYFDVTAFVQRNKPHWLRSRATAP